MHHRPGMSNLFEPGTLLHVRGEPWLLKHVTVGRDCTVLTLEGHGRSNVAQQMRVIEPFERARRLSARRPTRVRRGAALRTALAAISRQRLPETLWTAADASIDLWPYQLEPALAVLAGATRVLLADAVGLGKTIQAGLVLAELRERGWAERTLILCPAGLREMWASEVRERFRIDATVFDHAAIADRIASLPPGVNPWTQEPIVIASIDLVKRAEVMRAIAAAPIDLLIVDEAHHLMPGTDRGAAVAQLAERSPWCVFITATPHSGDQAAFDFLTRLGASGDELSVFRRSRVDVGRVVRRRAHMLRVTPTAEEAALLSAVAEYSQAIWLARGRHDRSARLVAVTIARRASSSQPALSRTLTRRLELLSGTVPIDNLQPPLPWQDDDRTDDTEDDVVLAAAGLDDNAAERAAIARLIGLAAACRTSSKFSRAARVLSRVREPVVLFTEYRDTLEAAVDCFRSTRRVAAIHGGLDTRQRSEAVAAFNSGDVDLLIATDTAGEGINLHHRCRLVIDLELPWNPVRLEQRLGRVDRLGQRRNVHAIRLFHDGGIESRVLHCLQSKQRAAAHAFVEPAADIHVADAIFGDAAVSWPPSPRLTSMRVDKAVSEAQRHQDQRRSPASAATAQTRWTRPRRCHQCALNLVHRTISLSETGSVASEVVGAHRVLLRYQPVGDRQWREVLAQAAQAISSLPRSATASAARAVVSRRVEVIGRRIAQRATTAYQAALFDARAEADAAERHRQAAGIEAGLRRVLRSMAVSPATDNTPVALVAAWPERRR